VPDPNAHLPDGVGSNESTPLQGTEEPREGELDDLQREALVVLVVLEIREVVANAGGVHVGDAQPGMTLLQPPREQAQMAVVVTDARVAECSVLEQIRDVDAQALIGVRGSEGSSSRSASYLSDGLDDLPFPQRGLAS
jgi:hypothetical protein